MYPIKKVITAFKFLLPLYNKAVKEEWDYDLIKGQNLYFGLCLAYEFHKNSGFLLNLFCDDDSHYKEFLDEYKMLFRRPFSNDYKEPIKYRRDFLQEQIPILQNLLKEGYTHI